MRSLKSGFSLLEVLAVVAMVGILAAIALPSYQKMVERARVRDAQTTLNMIFQAERIFRLDSPLQTDPLGTPQRFGSLNELVINNSLPDPRGSVDWTYVTTGVTATTFTATATRNGGGAGFVGTTIGLDQTFTGGLHYPPLDADGNPTKIYNGTHSLHD